MFWKCWQKMKWPVYLRLFLWRPKSVFKPNCGLETHPWQGHFRRISSTFPSCLGNFGSSQKNRRVSKLLTAVVSNFQTCQFRSSKLDYPSQNESQSVFVKPKVVSSYILFYSVKLEWFHRFFVILVVFFCDLVSWTWKYLFFG